MCIRDSPLPPSPPSSPPSSSAAGGNAYCAHEYEYEYELCAELYNPTWTPWGSSEVAVSAAELRSIRDELRWASSVAAGAAFFWLGGGALLSGGYFSLTSVPSESMAPGVHRGDLMLVDRRRSSVAAIGTGDVVLFAPPPKLVQQGL